MRKMSKFAGLLDKYGNVEEDTERHLGRINWSGHIKAQGSFLGSAFISGYQHDFIAKDLKSESNPRGSILREAKNYTDSKVATAGTAKHSHYISLTSVDSQVCFTYISDKADKYTIETLKSTLNSWDKRISCTGYWDVNPAMYIFGDGTNLKVGYVKNKTTQSITIDFVSINDYVD